MAVVGLYNRNHLPLSDDIVALAALPLPQLLHEIFIQYICIFGE